MFEELFGVTMLSSLNLLPPQPFQQALHENPDFTRKLSPPPENSWRHLRGSGSESRRQQAAS